MADTHVLYVVIQNTDNLYIHLRRNLKQIVAVSCASTGTTTQGTMDKIIDLQTVKLLSEDIEDQQKTLFEHKGVYFSEANVDKSMLDLMSAWEARNEDIFIVTYPKAGTTWTQEIMYLALNGGDVEKAQETHTLLRVPYLEGNLKPPKVLFSPYTPYGLVQLMPSPRFIKSHLPEHLLPPDIFTKKAKIVYVARNPKDLAVSYYQFHRWQSMLPTYDSWDKFYDDFMSGKVSYGKWYEHNLGYWKRRHEENILFIKYEDMKKDEKAAAKQISEFLGFHYADDILNRITEHCTFKSMKKNPMTNPDELGFREKGTTISFMRKGEVGDWKNYFTDAQNKAFNALYEDKLTGTGLEFDFE